MPLLRRALDDARQAPLVAGRSGHMRRVAKCARLCRLAFGPHRQAKAMLLWHLADSFSHLDGRVAVCQAPQRSSCHPNRVPGPSAITGTHNSVRYDRR